MKHTPGPWAQAPLSPVDILAADETMIAMAREGLNGISRDQAIANARLIAAAPELLAALRDARSAVLCIAPRNQDEIEGRATVLARIDAAIARAIGEA